MLTELNMFVRSRARMARDGGRFCLMGIVMWRWTCVLMVCVTISIPPDKPIANWVGARYSAASSFVADIAWAAAMRRMAVPIPMGLMLYKLVGSLWNETDSLLLMYSCISLGIDPE